MTLSHATIWIPGTVSVVPSNDELKVRVDELLL
jgi:hypothetical protein